MAAAADVTKESKVSSGSSAAQRDSPHARARAPLRFSGGGAPRRPPALAVAHRLREHPEGDRQPEELSRAEREPLHEDDRDRHGADGEACGAGSGGSCARPSDQELFREEHAAAQAQT